MGKFKLFGGGSDAELTGARVIQDTPSMIKISGSCKLPDSDEIVPMQATISKTEHGMSLINISNEEGAQMSDPRCVDAMLDWVKTKYKY